MSKQSKFGNCNRRDWLRSVSVGGVAAGGSLFASASGWLPSLANAAASDPKRKRACILLWMNGGPSHLDTLDPKPGHANGGPFEAIDTATPGIQVAEHLPKFARWTNESAIVRSMTGKEADHGRATYLVRTGRKPEGVVTYPTLGSFLSNELGDPSAALPNFVSVAPYRSANPAAYDSGFLGPRLAPFLVGDVTRADAQQQAADAYATQLKVADLTPSGFAATTSGNPAPSGSAATTPGNPATAAERAAARRALLGEMERRFGDDRPDAPVKSHQTAYERAERLMAPAAAEAFTLDGEPAKLRDAYGRNLFGQGCLLARRLVERGVPFVEVSLGGVNSGGMGWDTHVDNFKTVERLCGVLDPAWSTLLEDLRERGLLESTLVVWMGEFGRTPKINGTAGRDHYPGTWSAVLSGGGVKGGQVVGRTSDDGATVAEHPYEAPELLATICAALGIDPHKTNPSNAGRPIHLVDYDAEPIAEVLR